MGKMKIKVHEAVSDRADIVISDFLDDHKADAHDLMTSAFSEILYGMGPNQTIDKDLAEVLAEYAYRMILYNAYYYDQYVPTLEEFAEMCNKKRMETPLMDSTTHAFTDAIIKQIYMQYAPLLKD